MNIKLKKTEMRECPADMDKIGIYEYTESNTSGDYTPITTEAGKHFWEVRGVFKKYKRCLKCGIEEL